MPPKGLEKAAHHVGNSYLNLNLNEYVAGSKTGINATHESYIPSN